MAIRLQMGGDAGSSLEDLHRKAAPDQMGGGRQPDGAGTDHGHRE